VYDISEKFAILQERRVKMERIEILENIRTEYYNLTLAERKIADYILQNAEKVQFMSISELSDACQVADSTVSRFCRSLKLPGFNNFKLELAKTIAVSDDAQNETCDSSFQGRLRKTALEIQRVIDETIQLADEETVNSAVSLLEKADKVLCVGAGGALVNAMMFVHQFSTICDKFKTVGETHLQSMELAMMKPNDVLLVISHSGATKSGIVMLKQAKTLGITTILITHFPQSPAAEYADVVLRSGYDEKPLEVGAVPARAAALIVLDMLFREYYRRNKEQCEDHRRRIAEAVAEHHV